MNKLGKIITTGLVVASIGIIGANAETVDVGNKSYTFNEFETKFNGPLIRHNNQMYSLLIDDDANIQTYVVDLEDGKLKSTITDVNKTILNNMYGENVYVDSIYSIDNNTHKLVTRNLRFTDLFKYPEEGYSTEYSDLENVSELSDEVLPLVANYNDKIYVYVTGKIFVYDLKMENNKHKLLKTIEAESLLEKVKEEGYEYNNVAFYVEDCGENTCISLDLQETNNDTDETLYKNYIFNYDEELIETVSSHILSESTIKIENNQLKVFYIDKENDEYVLKTVVNGKVNNIYTLKNEFTFSIHDGFIIIQDIIDNVSYIYDVDMNLIKKYNDVGLLRIEKEITNKEEYINYLKYSPILNNISNGNYVVMGFDERSGDQTTNTKFNELLTVDNKKEVLTTKISGILKDSKGNNLKDYKVELNDLKTTTDKDGYFNFENIEEGIYKLVIKDKEDKIVLTKDLTIKNGEETKIDGDILYFKKGEGVNLNLKLTSDNNVEIESVDEYKKHNEAVPQTLDKIFIYLGITIILSLVSYIFVKKTSKIKYLKN